MQLELKTNKLEKSRKNKYDNIDYQLMFIYITFLMFGGFILGGFIELLFF